MSRDEVFGRRGGDGGGGKSITPYSRAETPDASDLHRLTGPTRTIRIGRKKLLNPKPLKWITLHNANLNQNENDALINQNQAGFIK